MLDAQVHPLLAPVVADFHARTPIRAWSLIVTVYGDCALPRGGELWLGTLAAVMKRAGVDDGSVRTAVSRLAREGWLERHRVGRNSFYRLSESGEAAFRAAARRIYGVPGGTETGAWRLVVLPEGEGRVAARADLRAAGWGEIGPATFLAPAHATGADAPRATGPGDLPAPAAPAFGTVADADARPVALAARSSAEDARRLAQLAWPLDRLAERYRGFLRLFEPVAAGLGDAGGPGDLDALVLRVLLVHAFRRIVLKDPALPEAALPEDWPGTRARALFREIFRALSPAAEHWLDRNGEARGGSLPPPDSTVEERLSVPVA